MSYEEEFHNQFEKGKEPCPSWCYTFNNYTDKDVATLKILEGIRRHRCCKEVGNNEETPHLQGVIVFTTNYRMAALKKILNCHWEPVKRLNNAINYCTKGEIIIDINFSSQGIRTDIQSAADMISEGISMKVVARLNPTVYIKYNRGLEKYQELIREPIDYFETKVFVYYGAPRVGKSRKVRALYPLLYRVPKPTSWNGTVWFDKYNGEKVLLFDDFYGEINCSYMLDICDCYDMQVPTKGGFVSRGWDTVIFTSNKSPSHWWTDDNQHREAFIARITKAFWISKGETKELQTL